MQKNKFNEKHESISIRADFTDAKINNRVIENLPYHSIINELKMGVNLNHLNRR